MKRAKTLVYLTITFLAVLNVGKVNAQIVINEFLASNTGAIVDPDFQESADWIEIYNAGSSAVNLGGYFLSDNFENKEKWEIPAGIQIAAKGFLIIWADGYDTGLHTSFKLSADGEELAIYSASGNLVDSVSFGVQEPNISMGRKTDGGAEWGIFLSPTPGAANSAENYNGIVQNVPQYSVLGGIFSAPVSVEIISSFGGEIRYTTDGSEPNENSQLANGIITVSSTKVIRSRIYQSGKVPGKVVTQTYFIDTNNEIGSLPVVSLVSDPDNFWDSEKGIYVQDFKPEWEIPINIELFENDGSDRAAFNLTAGSKVNGLYAWQLPQKMLGIYFRKEYGEGKLDYPLLFDHNRKIFDSFALRASGSDWAYTMFRDGMAQSLTTENMDVDFQGFRACVVFINGQYMGIHNMRSKVDEDFIVQNHELGDQKIDMIENENYVETGSIDQYAAFENLYKVDLTVQSNYDAVAAQMDIENFTDFMITEIYSQNTSVDHNIMAWKPQSGGKWKWILNDLDRTFFDSASNMISYYSDRNVTPLSHLLRNEGYREYFGKRLADHLFTTFDPNRVKSVIESFKTNIQDEMPKHIQRWQGTSSGYGNPISSVNYWNTEIEKMKTFAENRPAALLNDLTSYGFGQNKPLSIAISPENAGTIDFNGIKITQPFSQGGYPVNEQISLVANAKSGYVFKGWSRAEATLIIGKEQAWKYNDSGNEIAAGWMNSDFVDSEWSEGQAELGYGDGDEKTVLSFGGDSNNKIITTYFRKTFIIENIEDIQNLKISLKCDDGAVVYLNGTEVARQNLPAGTINRNTTALTAIGGSAESSFTVYSINESLIKTGNNTIAVEVHQANNTSSDISFDLELSAGIASQSVVYSTNRSLDFTHNIDESWIAVFESDGSCILPEEITAEMILNKSCSPYKVPENVTVSSTGKLVIEPGVELWISDDVSIKINGAMIANGTLAEPVVFRSNPAETKWGILNFVNADTSYLNNVVIEDASKGYHPLREIAAVSVFNSVLKINGAVIENVFENPVVARYSDVSLKNSRLHSEITGDLINVKYGKGFIDSCEFVGNDMIDTDGIDFDDVENGIIRNSIIRDFHGFNSDAIDIGEKAQNITIENMLVYNITDKGVSVGQQSSANISNSVFVNCNLGTGLKDSCRVNIDHCTFYGNGTSVACYEKNEGDAGGNATITNSILSNTYETTFSSDDKSTIKISHSASDNETLPSGGNNLFVNPQFKNPNLFDFSLAANSACLGTATNGNIGATLVIEESVSSLFISGIAFKSDSVSQVNEFIELTNSGNTPVNISGYKFTKGITFQFPEETTIEPGKKVYVAFNSNAGYWQDKGEIIYQWESGRLADEGETIQLETPQGMVVDHVFYGENNSWPTVLNGEGIVLKADNLDNHFGGNWEISDIGIWVTAKELTQNESEILLYPNPTSGLLYVSGFTNGNLLVDIFNITGVKVMSVRLNSGETAIDLSPLKQGIYLVKTGVETNRIVLSR